VRPIYGEKGAETPTACVTHKFVEEVDLIHPMCEFPGGCNKRPTFGKAGEKATFCAIHKNQDDVDCYHKRCEEEGCDTRPNYGPPGTRSYKYCVVHKKKGDIDLSHKKCLECDKIPVYGIPGTNQADYCKTHRQEGMLDIINKQCDFDGCTTKPCYGKAGTPVSRCSKHKLKGMIKKPNTTCRWPNCKHMAIWGRDFLPLNCALHKQDGQQNLVEEACVTCQESSILDATKQCENCNPESFKRVRLSKQNALMNWLDANGFEGDQTDKMIDGGECGKERPDRLFDFGDKMVVIECDEYAHRGQSRALEEKRMINIGQSLKGMPVYFIRWNPDVYAGGDAALSTRHEMAVTVLRNIKNGSMKLPVALTSVIYLYYDGWKGLHHEDWKVLTELEMFVELKNELFVATSEDTAAEMSTSVMEL